MGRDFDNVHEAAVLQDKHSPFDLTHHSKLHLPFDLTHHSVFSLSMASNSYCRSHVEMFFVMIFKSSASKFSATDNPILHIAFFK